MQADKHAWGDFSMGDPASGYDSQLFKQNIMGIEECISRVTASDF